MKFVLPLNMKEAERELSIPATIYKSRNGFEIIIDKFPLSEKQEMFGVEITNQDGTSYTYKQNRGMGPLSIAHGECLQANFKVIISGPDNDPTVYKIKEQAEFALKVIVGHGLPVCEIYDGSSLGKGIMSSDIRIISHRKIALLTKNHIARMSKLLTLLCSREIKDNDRTETLKFYLNIAMQATHNNSLSGAFYISILESVFAPDNNQEISYRFKMRMAKRLNKDISFAGHIRKLYDKRSKIFHGHKELFTADELIELETTATSIIEYYAHNPGDFTQEALDKQLLSEDSNNNPSPIAFN